MGDQTDSQVANEDTSASQAETSQTQSGEAGNSLAGAQLAEAVKADPEAMKVLRPLFQSEKDKGIAKIQQELDALKEVLPQANSTEPPGGEVKPETAKPASADEILALKAAYPLDWNDPNNAKLFAEFSGDNLLAELGKKLVGAKSKPTPTPAGVTAPSGGQTPASAESIAHEIETILSDRNALFTEEGRKKLADARRRLQEQEQA